MLRNGQLPAGSDKVKHKAKHAVRFTAVKDSRNRKVRGLWRRGGKWYTQTRVSGEKSARRVPLGATTLEAAKAEMADVRKQKGDEGLKQPLIDGPPEAKPQPGGADGAKLWNRL